jgi:hypothetical protein
MKTLRHYHTFCLCTVLFALFTVSAQAQPAGLVSWWKAENNGLDAQGANNGVAVGTVNYAPGVVGEAFALANGGYIDVLSPTLNAYTSGFTVAAWTTLTAYSPNSSAALINFRNNANIGGWTLEQSAGTPGSMSFYVDQGAGFHAVNSPGWQLNTPYYVAATFDAATGTMALYRDGVLQASRNDLSLSDMATVSSPILQIGRNSPSIGTNDNWSGLIDEVQFYDHALTSTQVATLATASIPEPSTLALFSLSFTALGFIVRRKRII